MKVNLNLIRALENNGARFVAYFENPLVGMVLLQYMIDENFIDKDTLLWIDKKAGKKEMLLSILKDVKKKKLFIQSFNQSTILKVALRIFGVNVKNVQTLKQAKQIHSINFDELIYHAEAFQRSELYLP
jgi:hypothetical protein